MSDGSSAGRTLKVDQLARVEGEGSLHVQIHDGVVTDVQLRIFEPPRFFEAFLRGRSYQEPPDITARICGICPVAYQMSVCRAIEAACGVSVGGALRDLRRLLYCGEWIESHALHVYLLHAPDFLGLTSAIELAKHDRALVERGLRLKKAGNSVLDLLGGRAVHPINVRVGGFYRVPQRHELMSLVDELRRARDDAVATVAWVSSLDFPDVTSSHEYVALLPDEGYPLLDGRVRSSRGIDIDEALFDTVIEETQVSYSNALHAGIVGRGHYLVGPMARYNLASDRLSPLAREVAGAAGLGDECHNPFRSIVIRSVEIVEACEQALGIIERYEPPAQAAIEVRPRRGTGHAITEAPRGLLFHAYTLDDSGTIVDARIIPPTSQNQPTIEDDLRRVLEANLGLDDDRLRQRCEQAIRNHDPCISSATHFLDLEVERS